VNSPPYNVEPTLMQLVSDLVSDAKELLRQELTLAKYEITQEVHKTKRALISLGAGIGIISVGGLLLLVMLVHALNALTGLPLWACYGIIGGMLAIVGMLMIYSGKKTISQIDMIPQQTVESMKENARWIKEKAISNGV
jgi:Putative Actinobacterial Holin-X, holin superfamily III